MALPKPKGVYHWSAKRAATSITINGFLANGSAVKLVGVPSIEYGKKGKGPIVSDKAGDRFELVSE